MIISGNNIWIDEKFKAGTIEVENGKIVNIKDEITEDAKVFYGDNYIIPGLIDVHTHGYGGGDASDGDSETIRNWIKYYPKEGVTTFLPGTVTRSEERLVSALKAINKVINEDIKGANLYGIFFQGPYTSHEYKGAYDPYLIQKPNLEQFKMFIEASGNNIKMLGLAVEKDDNHEVLKYAINQGIKVSLGHSGVSYDEAKKASQEGANNITHCFNNMNSLHHRVPGLPGAALSIDELYTEVIADGIHIHPAVINIIGKCKGKDRLIVITDSSRYKGLPPGYYESVDRKVTIGEDGVGRLPDGKLAGCTITLIDSVKNLMELGNLSQETAINAATINPANMLGIGDKKGLIKEGYDCDICIYDKDYKVIQTYCMGEKML